MDKLAAFYEYEEKLKGFIAATTTGLAVGETFEELALDLFALQRVHNPVYERFCESLGVDSPGNWSEFPFLPTAAFKDFEVSVFGENERTTVFRSSGTTRQNRGAHFHNQRSLDLYESSLLPWFEKHLLGNVPRSLRIVSLSPGPSDAAESSLVHMFEVVSRRFAPNCEPRYFATAEWDGAWKLDLAAVFKALNELISRGEPVLLLGTAFSFVHLLDGMDSMQLPAGSRVMETGGYKGRSRVVSKTDLHRLMEAKLGILPNHIVTEYGMSELSSQAYDRICGETLNEALSFHFPPWVRTRIISPETGVEVAEGEPGLLQIIDLANAYSVAAIQTEDIAIRTASSFQLLGRAEESKPRGCSLMPAA